MSIASNLQTLDLTTLAANIQLEETIKPRSIRQIILQGLDAGRSTNEIAAEVKRLHPDSAAAAKSAKHIAYYRCLVKQGKA